MPHGAFLGMTTAGKTYAAQQVARRFRSLGIGVLALHKPREPWPAACVSWQTDSPDAFLAMFWASRGCACFMELADADVEATDTRFHKCFTQGRHEGHRCYFLSQRAAQVHPNIRENCTSLYLFAVSTKAAKLWADEFNDPALLGASALNPRDHLCYQIPERGLPARLVKITP